MVAVESYKFLEYKNEFLEKYNLDLPNIASVAKELKERQLIDFDTLPLTKEDLYKVIVKEEKNNE